MAQTLEFSATDGMTLTATRCAVGAYTGTAADSVTQQSGTNRYLAVFSSNVTGAYRLDYKLSGTTIGSEVYDLSGSGTFQPRSESQLNAAGIRTAVGLATANLDTQLDALPTAAEITDAVWDEATSGHATAGTTGAAITTASSAVTVVPVVGSVQSRVDGTSIVLFTKELATVAVGVVDADGVAVDLTGLTLELIFESGSTEVVIVDANITKTASSFSFTATTALTTAERLWKWALRKTTDESVLLTGTLEVVYAANN